MFIDYKYGKKLWRGLKISIWLAKNIDQFI